jgi:hypothetical protein
LFAYAAHGLSIQSELAPPVTPRPADPSKPLLSIRVGSRRGAPSTSGFDVDIRPDVVEFDHFEFDA